MLTMKYRFLLVKYQMNRIVDADDPLDILDILENLPADLSEAYSIILERIRAKKRLDSAYRIFSWLYHATRPM